MPFTWTNSATGKVEGDDKTTSILKEIKTNIQSLYTTLGLGTVSYTEDISDNFIRASNITELRNKINYMQEHMNACTTVNTAVKSSVDQSFNSGYNSTKYNNYDGNYNSNYDGSYNSGYNGGYHGSYDSGYQSGYLGWNYYTYECSSVA